MMRGGKGGRTLRVQELHALPHPNPNPNPNPNPTLTLTLTLALTLTLTPTPTLTLTRPARPRPPRCSTLPPSLTLVPGGCTPSRTNALLEVEAAPSTPLLPAGLRVRVSFGLGLGLGS